MPPLFSLFFFFTFSLISFTLLILILTHKPKKNQENPKPIIKIQSFPPPDKDISETVTEKIEILDPNIVNIDETHDPEILKNQENDKPIVKIPYFPTPNEDITQFVSEKIVILDPNIVDIDETHDPEPTRAGSGRDNKKRRKRGKKKKGGSDYVENNGEGLVGLECPFTTSCSVTQRKIKQHYDQLVKCHKSNVLTLTQVADFISCLMEARNELQHKSEVIKRKFTITKALLFKADRSSFDRLSQQIFKLESEQKRLEDDASVYNWLHQQVKLSPAYKKLLQFSIDMEQKEKAGEVTDTSDAEFSDISFEELLAQEKKDVFWQKHGKPKQLPS